MSLTCVVCKKNNPEFVCSHNCHTTYCSEICAKSDWQSHFAMCGDYLDTLPNELLFDVLSRLSFKDLYSSAQISRQFAFLINTPAFRKVFALKHKGEWDAIVMRFFSNRQKNKLKIWLPILLETNVWDPSVDNNMPIIMACEQHWYKIVKILIADPRVNPAVKNNLAAYFAASDLKILKLLLADARVKNSVNYEPILKRAIEKQNISILEFLLKDVQVDLSVNENDAIKRVIRFDFYAGLSLLLEDSRINPNVAFVEAVFKNKVAFVRLLLADSRVDPSFDDNHAIQIACSGGFVDIVKLLLEDPRVDPPSAILNDAFYSAVNVLGGKFKEVVRLLENYFKRKEEREAGQEGETKRLKLGRVLF